MLHDQHTTSIRWNAYKEEHELLVVHRRILYFEVLRNTCTQYHAKWGENTL